MSENTSVSLETIFQKLTLIEAKIDNYHAELLATKSSQVVKALSFERQIEEHVRYIWGTRRYPTELADLSRIFSRKMQRHSENLEYVLREMVSKGILEIRHKLSGARLYFPNGMASQADPELMALFQKSGLHPRTVKKIEEKHTKEIIERRRRSRNEISQDEYEKLLKETLPEEPQLDDLGQKDSGENSNSEGEK
jgi:Mor family transcriptional regulator